MTQNVEIFKALRIIKIMLFCAKTKKKKTLHTGCFISPFAATQTSSLFLLFCNFCCLILFQHWVISTLKWPLTLSALLWRQQEASPHILFWFYINLLWGATAFFPLKGQHQKYTITFLNILSVKFMILELSPLCFFCKLPLQIWTHTGGTLLNSTTRRRRSRVRRRLCCSSTVAPL